MGEEVNLNRWKWLREISKLETEMVEQYKRQAQKNEVLMVDVYGRDSYNIYVPIRSNT